MSRAGWKWFMWLAAISCGIHNCVWVLCLFNGEDRPESLQPFLHMVAAYLCHAESKRASP
jgi:hypothetical protein